MNNEQMIQVETTVNAPIETIWERWTKPEHIVNWYFASDDWEAPGAENDLRVGGAFLTKMSAKDKSAGFDFTGRYDEVVPHERIVYTMSDGRRVITRFSPNPDGVTITQMFDPESTHSREVQESGWQAILDNFKKYVELSA